MTDKERLKAYDEVYESLLKEREQVQAEMQRLKELGKIRGVAYQQMIAHKLMVQTLLDRFKAKGIEPPAGQKE